MTTDRVSWRFGYTATALFLAFMVSPQSSGSEQPHPIASLTMAERRNLSGNTQVTLPSGRTVTLEVLREEHRAHEESVANAASLGRAFAARMIKPTTLADASVKTQAATLAPAQPVAGGAGSAGFRTAATQQPKHVVDAFSPKNSGVTGGQPPRPNNNAVTTFVAGPETVARGLLVPLPVFTVQTIPVPVDYYTFCRAAQASACVYLPANVTFYPISGLLEFDDWLADAITCANEGGYFVQVQGVCQFYYYDAADTRFTPGAALSSAESCDPGSKYSVNPSAYKVDPKGLIMASYPPAMVGNSFSLPKPVSCVVQVWVVPWP